LILRTGTADEAEGEGGGATISAFGGKDGLLGGGSNGILVGRDGNDPMSGGAGVDIFGFGA